MLTKKPVRIVKKIALCGVVCVALTGCAETIIVGLTISELLTAGSLVSAVVSGKGLGEHALDVVTGQDCRILEAVFRQDRAICEPKNSIATKGDFKGLVALLDSGASNSIQLAKIPMGKDQFPTINAKSRQHTAKLLSDLTHKNLIPSGAVAQTDKARAIHLTIATNSFNTGNLTVATTEQPRPVGKTDLRNRLTKDLF
jgi:hypothetical protein